MDAIGGGALKRRLRKQIEDPTVLLRARGRVMNPYWRYRFHAFGRSSVLHKPMWLAGAHKISVGERVLLLRPWLSVEESAWERSGPVLTIGARVGIRPFCAIRAAESVTIEDAVGFASHTFVTDFANDIDGPDAHVKRNSPITAPVRIGYGTGIGERSVILPGSNVGRHCVVGTNSVVRGDIPDYSIAFGNPARVIGRTRAM